MMRNLMFASTLLAILPPAGAATALPVREITVFKDGHALVVHEGEEALRDGEAILRGLPGPVLGSFFPFTSDAELHVSQVRTMRLRGVEKLEPHSFAEMLEAARGHEVTVLVRGQEAEREITGRVLEVVRQKPAPTPTPAPSYYLGAVAAGSIPGREAELVLLETSTGVTAIRAGDIIQVNGREDWKDWATDSEGFVVTVEAADGGHPDSATIGYAYVQRGIRWIPSYTLRHEDGEAVLTLQATLINEVTDLENVTARLAVGVPKFEFEGMHDPMAPLDFVANLSSFFPTGQASASGVSRAMMSQVAMMNSMTSPSASGGDSSSAPPADADAEGELYFFTVENLTLKRGERAVVTLARERISPADKFRLNVPFMPPQSFADDYGGRWNQDTRDGRALADALAAPKVVRVIEFANHGKFPFTTAPVMVFDEQDRFLAQSMLRYTPIGGTAEIELNQALNIVAVTDHRQISHEPNKLRVDGSDYSLITNEGTVTLTNRRDNAVKVAVRRDLFGKVLSSQPEGNVTSTPLGDVTSQRRDAGIDYYYWYWPRWYTSLNGFNRLEWEVELAPGEEESLTARWEYYWR